jgi:hypothetical protein
MTNLFSPEAVIMLFLAGLLDIIGIICLILDAVLGIGEIFSYIPDTIGIIFFGAWVVFRAATKEAGEEKLKELKGKLAERREEREGVRKKKLKKKVAKKGMNKGLKFGLASLGEIIPFLGALPFWTIYVYSELKSE